MARIVYGDNTTCPECSAMLSMDVDVNDGCLHDICLECGFKRKKELTGRVISIAGIKVDSEWEDEC